MDAITLSFLLTELRERVVGWHISRFEPLDNGFSLSLRGEGEEAVFIFDLSPKMPGIFLAEREPEKSERSSPFLLLLKKYLPGSRINEIRQVELDRVVIFSFTAHSPMKMEYQLILELIPKKPNAVLTDASLTIIGTAKNINNEKRSLLPGGKYKPPEIGEKENPFAINEERFKELEEQFQEEDGVKFLVSHFLGISPLFAKEIVKIAEEREIPLSASFFSFVERLKKEKPSPTIYYPDMAKLPIEHQLLDSETVMTPFPFQSLKGLIAEYFPDFITASAAFYQKQKEIEAFLKGRREIKKALERNRERLSSLIKNLKEDLSRSEKAEEYRRYGELIIANLNRLKGKREGERIKLIDYYHPEQKEIEIPIEPTLSPRENAERYFKLASKAEKGRKVIEKRLAEAEKRLSKIEGLIQSLEEIDSPEELSELEGELIKLGLMQKEGGRTKEKEERKPYRRFISSEGWEILVGRSAKDNDILTFKVARPEDFWLHASEAKGSHVVVRNPEKREELPANTLREAAEIAAYYSKRRNSTWAFVHYTKRKYLKKPKGFPPGKVLLLRYKALTVKPGIPEKIKEALSSTSI